jgi:hypothetical protein
MLKLNVLLSYIKKNGPPSVNKSNYIKKNGPPSVNKLSYITKRTTPSVKSEKNMQIICKGNIESIHSTVMIS